VGGRQIGLTSIERMYRTNIQQAMQQVPGVEMPQIQIGLDMATPGSEYTAAYRALREEIIQAIVGRVGMPATTSRTSLALVDQPRPSSNQLFMNCAMSHRQTSTQVRLHDDGLAHLGRAVHTICVNHHIGDGKSFAECLQLARTVGEWYGEAEVCPEDCSYLVGQFFRMWPETRGQYQYRPEPGYVMDDMEPEFYLAGEPDIFAVSADAIVCGDIKTGWAMQDAYHQIMSYLWILRKRFSGRNRYIGYIYHLRHEKTIKIVKTDQALVEWHDGYVIRCRQNESYHVGDHCTYCKHVMHCQAIKDAVNFLIDDPHTIINENLGYALELARTAKVAIGAVENAKQAMVRASGGLLNLGDGREIRETTQWRKVYDVAVAWPVLVSLFGQEATARMFRLTTKALTEAIKQRYPHDPVNQIMRSVMERLANAGAITEMPTTIIRSSTDSLTVEE